jgi:hypothetical protein
MADYESGLSRDFMVEAAQNVHGDSRRPSATHNLVDIPRRR